MKISNIKYIALGIIAAALSFRLVAMMSTTM